MMTSSDMQSPMRKVESMEDMDHTRAVGDKEHNRSVGRS
jgi:hypothetical protein